MREVLIEEATKKAAPVPTITVIVRGGVVQDVQFGPDCPLGLEARVHDYDTEALTEEELEAKAQVDSEGDHFSEGIWTAKEEENR